MDGGRGALEYSVEMARGMREVFRERKMLDIIEQLVRHGLRVSLSGNASCEQRTC